MFLGVESVDALCRCTNILFTSGTRDLRTPMATPFQSPWTRSGPDRRYAGIKTMYYVNVQTSYLLARDSVFVTPCSSFTRFFLQHPFRLEPVLLGGSAAGSVVWNGRCQFWVFFSKNQIEFLEPVLERKLKLETFENWTQNRVPSSIYFGNQNQNQIYGKFRW